MPSEQEPQGGTSEKKPIPDFLTGGPSAPEIEQKKSGAGMDRRVERNKWSVRRLGWMVAAGVIAVGILYLVVFGDHRPKLNVELNRIVISEVKRGPFQEFIVQRGTALPVQTQYLDALEGGQVKEILLEEGALVEKGTPILRLTNPSLEQRVLSQEATLFEQINNMENTRLNLETRAIRNQQELMRVGLDLLQKEREYARLKALADRGLVAKDRFHTAEESLEYASKLEAFMVQTVQQDSLFRVNQLASLEARAGSLQRQLDDVRRPLENLTVRAPVAGQLSQLNAEIGELIAQGARIGQVDVLDGYKVHVLVDEFYVARVRKGLKGTCEYEGRVYPLVIRRVFPEVRDGQFGVDMDFVGDAPPEIRRGQSIQIKLELDDPAAALLLARGAFYQTTGGGWAFVVDESGTSAERRRIRIGRQNPEYFEVLDGLVPGERVVTSSYDTYEEVDLLVIQK